MQTLDLDGLRYRPFDYDKDTEQACALFQTVFGPRIASAHWLWKYQQGPNAGLGVAVQDISSGRLVGHMGVITLPGIQAGKPLAMGQVCDVMIHPEHRSGLGPDSIYARMNQTLERLTTGRDIYLFGFPGRTPANLGIRIGVYRRLGICHTSQIPQEWQDGHQHWWHKWRTWLPTALRAKACQQLDASHIPKLDRIWTRNLPQPATPQSPGNDEYMRPRIVKNAAYVRWRYFSAQHTAQQRYTLWWLHQGRDVIGWLMTALVPQPIVIDSCLPSQLHWLDASIRALPTPTSLGTQGNWVTWLPLSAASVQPTPIHAVEILGRPWHNHWPSPQFQPGDTDVF